MAAIVDGKSLLEPRELKASLCNLAYGARVSAVNGITAE